MEFNEYQTRALSTAIFPNDNSITYLSLALCGEAGEIADKVKKVIRDQNGKYSPPDLEAIAMEIGDVLWYAANLANALGYDFDRVAALNLDKIISRFERGTLHGNGDTR